MSNYKFLTLIISFLTLICFTIKAYAITENQYLIINKLINEENIDKAFSDLKLIQKDEVKLSARSQILIGKIYLALEQPAKAFTFFEKATFTSVSTDDLAYAGMSMAAIKLGNLSDAKNYAEKALKENPDLVDAKLALGLIFADYGQMKEAEIHFKKAILASRNSLISIRAYASSKLRQGRHKEAINIITNALLERKSDAATTDLLGKIFWIEGNIKEAVRLRSDASEMFRKSGNIQRAEQILSWLNTAAMPKVNEIRKSERIKKEKIEKKKVKKKTKPSQPKLTLPKRVSLKPETRPEEIFVDKDKPTYTGSGVILNDGKWIITNKHVIEGSKYIIVRNGLGKVREVEAVEVPTNENTDLALLKLKKPFPSSYSLSIDDIKSPKAGEQIYVMGYPMSSILGRYNPSISEGIVSKTSGFGEMVGEFQITAKMNKGNSGGPIFNDKGQIIGISVGKLNKSEVLKNDGFIPEDVNVGISGQVVTNFLNMPVKANLDESEKYDASQIYEYMRPSVVFIVSQ
ncbi:trypsin-like peptidase domain-containing protein [bacterium]|nr:trypsin-like peptidase domain-containing protein [bacterium]